MPPIPQEYLRSKLPTPTQRRSVIPRPEGSETQLPRVTVRCQQITVTYEDVPDCPSLGTLAVCRHTDPEKSRYYNVIHVPTGRAVLLELLGEAEATRAMKGLWLKFQAALRKRAAEDVIAAMPRWFNRYARDCKQKRSYLPTTHYEEAYA